MTNKINKNIIYFMMYSTILWIYNLLNNLQNVRCFISNNILVGPYYPSFGITAITLILLFYNYIKELNHKDRIKSIPILYIICMFLYTITNIIKIYILKNDIFYLDSILIYGVYGIVILYLIQPIFELLINKLNEKAINILSIILLIILVVDCMYSLVIR